MEIFQKIKDYKNFIFKFKNKSIGFVPTMGALHDGHLSLLKRARIENDILVLSIFVNPIQFGANEDFNQYPRTLENDILLAKNSGVDIVFAPLNEEMYPSKLFTFVEVENISSGLCSLSRPNHFRGVTTVVSKLFNIIMPNRSYFGQKDYQQFLIINKMVEDLNFNTEIVLCETVRESDGLAMSSRNKYLSYDERKKVVCLFQALSKAESLIKNGVTDVNSIKKEMLEIIKNVTVDYIFIGNGFTLESMESLENYKGRLLIAGAIYIGKTRLIDNFIVEK